MTARRLTKTTVAWLCALAGTVTLCGAPALAAGDQVLASGSGGSCVTGGCMLGQLEPAALTVTPFASGASAPAVTFAGPGEGAGQVDAPASVAVDQSTGEPTSGRVYVGEFNNSRISAFDSTGKFLLAFGSGVRNGFEEPETCGPLATPPSISCQPGIVNYSWGGETRASSIVVDPATHYIYAAEGGSSHRVQVFDSAGRFLFMFGREVDRTKVEAHASEAEQNICTAASGDTCGRGEFDSGPGGFQNGPLPIAIDSAHDLWVGDTERLERFTPQGEFLSEVALPGAEEIAALAFDPATSNFYTISQKSGGGEFLPGVAKRKPTGEPIETLDASGNARALALDPATGAAFVNDESQSAATLLEYDSSGNQTEAFGAGEVIGHPFGSALAFGEAAERLYVVSDAGGENAAAQYFALPEPGPLVQPGSTKAGEIHKTSATLNSTFNSEGAATTYHFQYIPAKQYEEDGEQFGAGTVATPESAASSADFEAHQASFEIAPGQLAPAGSYRFRLVATNENGSPTGNPGETASFETLEPAAIESTSVADITSNSATLLAAVNPLGDPTSYRFEYLTQAAYDENGGTFAGALVKPVPDGRLGAGSQGAAVFQHIAGLLARTTYRYRVTVINSLAPLGFSGPAKTFTTQSAGGAALLPDGRAWEMVSPPDKHAALISPIGEHGVTEAASGGDAFTYLTNAPTEANPEGYDNEVHVLSARGPHGWSSHDIAPANETATGLNVSTTYPFFAPDLSRAVLQPNGAFSASISPEASEQTAYLRTDFPPGDPTAFCSASCYRPLVTGKPGFANVPPGTVFGFSPSEGEQRACPNGGLKCGPQFEAANPDLSHVVLEYPEGLTSTTGDRGSLYEWFAGQLQLVSILPADEGGGPDPNPIAAGVGYRGITGHAAISVDGSRVVWNAPSPTEGGAGGNFPIYLRDMSLGETVRLDVVQPGATGAGQVSPIFQFASSDDSKIFFTDTRALTPDASHDRGLGDLYECEVRVTAGHLECHLTDLTPRLPSGETAKVAGWVMGGSEDGSYIYFAAGGALSADSHPTSCGINGGELCNIYLLHFDGNTWEAPRLIATLSSSTDYPSFGVDGFPVSLNSRVSPDGRWFAFMSDRSLTGYDNRDAKTGRPDEEVFLYHASAAQGEGGKLICASCNPTGARPIGVEFESKGFTVGLDGSAHWPKGQGLAASIPSWSQSGTGKDDFGVGTRYQARYLSDSGRLFFNANDALVPQDTNGTGDVYQYEPPASASGTPPNDGCTTASASYSSAAEGCIDLISSGTSPEESGFLDASESGNDIFFFTNARLAASDTDSARDVYDAHVCTASSPCPPPPPPPAPACVGDACQSAVAPPEDSTPGSVTFSGPGNPLREQPPSLVKKTATQPRAAKLTRALKACKRIRSKAKHAKCEKAARKRYGAAKRSKQATYNRRAQS